MVGRAPAGICDYVRPGVLDHHGRILVVVVYYGASFLAERVEQHLQLARRQAAQRVGHFAVQGFVRLRGLDNDARIDQFIESPTKTLHPIRVGAVRLVLKHRVLRPLQYFRRRQKIFAFQHLQQNNFLQALVGQQRLEQVRPVKIILRPVPKVACEREIAKFIVPSHLQILFGDKEPHLPKEVVITARRHSVSPKKHAVIAAVRHQAQKLPHARMRPIEFVQNFRTLFHDEGSFVVRRIFDMTPALRRWYIGQGLIAKNFVGGESDEVHARFGFVDWCSRVLLRS